MKLWRFVCLLVTRLIDGLVVLWQEIPFGLFGFALFAALTYGFGYGLDALGVPAPDSSFGKSNPIIALGFLGWLIVLFLTGVSILTWRLFKGLRSLWRQA